MVLQYHLEPLSKEESVDYIKHRLKKAGNEAADIFMDEAIEEIYNYSKGVPRLINLACHNALIGGIVKETRRITKAIALDAIKECLHGAEYVTNIQNNTKTEEERWEELQMHLKR